MITKARQIIKDVLNRFYMEHHDKDTLETELANEVNGGRIGGFSAAKRRAIEALDYRIENLQKGYEAVREKLPNDSFGWEARIDELETFRHFVKGMVVKVDE